MQRLPVKDDNLRLILSKNHGRWLDNEVRDRWVAIVILLIVLAMAVGGFAYSFSASDEDDTSTIIYVDDDIEDSVIEEYKNNGFTIVRGKAPDPVEETNFLPALVGISSIIIIIASPFFIGKAILEIITLFRWKTEHREFLASYNRPVD